MSFLLVRADLFIFRVLPTMNKSEEIAKQTIPLRGDSGDRKNKNKKSTNN